MRTQLYFGAKKWYQAVTPEHKKDELQREALNSDAAHSGGYNPSKGRYYVLVDLSKAGLDLLFRLAKIAGSPFFPRRPINPTTKNPPSEN